jgi:hypothetical protein
MKSSCKTKVTVQTDYHGFLYQLKVYTATIEIILGDDSIISIHLANLYWSIKKYSHSYKLAITQDKCFPGKVLNVINTCFNLFLEDCRKLLDREDVNNQLIKFGEIHKNVIFNKFNNASLPASFTLVNKVKKTGKDDAAINPKVTLKPTNKKTLQQRKVQRKQWRQGRRWWQKESFLWLDWKQGPSSWV